MPTSCPWAGGASQGQRDGGAQCNYLMHGLKGAYIFFRSACMHECLHGPAQENLTEHTRHCQAADRLRFHPPTIYFPLWSKRLMMEPTETESKENLDRFIRTMIQIAREAEEQPDLLRQAPGR